MPGVLVIAAALAAAPLAKPGGPLAPPPAPPIPPAHTAAMLALYPPAARAAGVEGEASLECAAIARGAPDRCKVVSEHPDRQGFGQAALALARLSPPFAAGPSKPAKPVWRIDFSFRLKPPGITPDVVAGVHIAPRWIKSPSEQQMRDAYPNTAMQSRTEGLAILFCVITPEGRLTRCEAKATPERFGFERAALQVAPDFTVQTTTDDGASTAGTTMTLPILFALP